MKFCPPVLGGGCVSSLATHRSEFSIWILLKKSSDFVQKVPLFFFEKYSDRVVLMQGLVRVIANAMKKDFCMTGLPGM
ncbi:MAG: hypothetical protein NC831_07620 [Candidatus Omnitrophica bacterium]|nr:hypothetical protein [Candidatus Omnitrophota bacterium]MCM8827833.1 hypothetical protein [Candidatus Omnitrophota bacterium]